MQHLWRALRAGDDQSDATPPADIDAGREPAHDPFGDIDTLLLRRLREGPAELGPDDRLANNTHISLASKRHSRDEWWCKGNPYDQLSLHLIQQIPRTTTPPGIPAKRQEMHLSACFVEFRAANCGVLHVLMRPRTCIANND
jgi:hypothetical protein